MQRLLSLAFRAVSALGWLLLALAVLLLALEHSGALRLLLEREATARLAALGEEVRVERARLDWFQPALLVSGVEIGSAGEVLRVEQVRVTFPMPWSGGGQRARIEATDGRLTLSQPLLDGLRRLALESTDEPGARASIPTLQVENLAVEIDTATLGRLPLGRVDAALTADRAGRPALVGRLIPSLAAQVQGPGQVYLEGHEQDDGVYVVSAKALDLPLSSDVLAETTSIRGVEPYAPRGSLALDAKSRWNMAEGTILDASVRLSLERGSIRAAAGDLALEDIALELEAVLPPRAERHDVRDAAAWRALGRARARSGRTELRAELGWGADAGEDALARLTVTSPRAALEPLLRDLVGSFPKLELWCGSIAVRGEGALWLGARLARPPDAGRTVLDDLELAGAIELDGQAGATYPGFVSLRGERDIGFPLPVEQVRGRVVVARAPARLRPLRAGLIDLAGKAQGGSLTARGVVSSPPVDLPPYLAGARHPELELSFSARDVPVDERLERAFAGLHGILPPAQLWQRYRPSGGTLSAAVRLARSPEMRSDAALVRVGLDGVGLTWSALPVPMQELRGEVVFTSDGQRGWGVGFHGQGHLRTAKALSIAGRFQRETPEVPTGRIDQVEVAVERFSLAGDDQRILTESVPALGAGLVSFEPRGFADLLYRRVHAVSDGPTETTVEVTAGDPVRLTPEHFKMVTSDVRGRVLARQSEPPPPAPDQAEVQGFAPRLEVNVAPIVGTWGPEIEVAIVSSRDARGATRTQVFGAGIDPSSKSLLGSLTDALGGAGSALFATDAFTLDGRLDFAATLDGAAERAPGGGAGAGAVASTVASTGKLDGRYRFHLRENRLSASRFTLDGLRGKLELDSGTLLGERLTARLGATPVVLTGASFTRNEGGFRFQTRVDARDVSLDPEHLRTIIDAQTLEPLVAELKLAGTLDVEGGSLVVEGPPEGGNRVVFEGVLRPHDARVVLGLPISVDSAIVDVRQLVFETGKVRGWAQIEGLRGRIADRNLGPARMLVTYVEPRLSIESLDAVFEGGRAAPLGGSTARGSSAFSIDLVAPFPFQLALDLREVQLAGLLRGLFASSIAAQGTLSCRLRLTGDTGHLLGLSGAGTFELDDSRLWSIPVFRALFSQLGLDDTAIFDSMSTNVRLRDGVIQTNDIEVHSPLLQLVGSGTVDLDGTLRHDLEVRYAILDYLGPLRRLFYSIQNRLLSVAIRGDLDRPLVFLRNPLTGIFGGRAEGRRELPLPDLAPLPDRF